MILTKSFKRIAFAAVLILSTQSTSTISPALGAQSTAHHDQEMPKYVFLRYKLFKGVSSAMSGTQSSWKEKALYLGAALCLYRSAVSTYENKSLTLTIPRNDLKCATFLGGLTAWYYTFKHAPAIEKQLKIDAVLNYVTNWTEYKKETPAEFHELFDELAEMLANEGEEAVKAVAYSISKKISYYLDYYFDFHDYLIANSSKSTKYISTLTAPSGITRFLGGL